MRFVAELVVLATLAVPTAASYPVNVKYCPSADRFKAPSDVADALSVRMRFDPLTAVGMWSVWTKTPAVVYSSRSTSVAALVVPFIRRTTRFPGVNEDAARSGRTRCAIIRSVPMIPIAESSLL
jgi:hypothetical protein